VGWADDNDEEDEVVEVDEKAKKDSGGKLGGACRNTLWGSVEQLVGQTFESLGFTKRLSLDRMAGGSLMGLVIITHVTGLNSGSGVSPPATLRGRTLTNLT